MADETSNTNGIRQPGTEPLPAPGIAMTRTRPWLALRYPETTTPEGAVIMNNLAVLLDRIGRLEAILTATSPGGRKRCRSSSVGSATSSMSATSAGGGNANSDQDVGDLVDQAARINTATKSTGTWRYVSSSKNAGTAAQNFWQHSVEFFSDVVVEDQGGGTGNPIIDDLKSLTNIDAKIRIFLDFGKRYKADKNLAATRKSPRGT